MRALGGTFRLRSNVLYQHIYLSVIWEKVENDPAPGFLQPIHWIGACKAITDEDDTPVMMPRHSVGKIKKDEAIIKTWT